MSRVTKDELTPLRQRVLNALAEHGTLFERDWCSPSVGKALHSADLVFRCPGSSGGRIATLSQTEAGHRLVSGPCDCRRCRRRPLG